MIHPNDWHTKRLIDFTFGDALDAMAEGFYCICKDGKVGILTNEEDWYE